MPAPKSEEQQELDAALAASFPASDPPAMTAPATATSAMAADGDEELKRRRSTSSAWCRVRNRIHPLNATTIVRVDAVTRVESFAIDQRLLRS